MITTTHSHKHWTEEGGHVNLSAPLPLYSISTNHYLFYHANLCISFCFDFFLKPVANIRYMSVV